MSDNQFRKHLDLFEGFWNSEETAQEIINSLSDGDVSNLTSDEIYRLVDEFVEMGDSPHAADRDEIAQIIMDRMGVYNDEENLDIDLNKHGIDPEGEYEEVVDVDYGDGMHDRENEDPEVYTPSNRWQYESVELSNIVESVLDLEEAPRKKMPPRQKVPVEPMDDEDEFAAPERPVDVGDDIDFEDNIDDLDLDNLGIYVELDDY